MVRCGVRSILSVNPYLVNGMSTDVVDALFARAREKAAEAAVRAKLDTSDAPRTWCGEAALEYLADSEAYDEALEFANHGAVAARLAQRRIAPRRKPIHPGLTAGGAVLTTSGVHPVEALRPGDELITSEHRGTRILSIQRIRVDEEEMARHRELGPILIRAGALGPNLPTQDLVVAPLQEVALGQGIRPRRRRTAVSLLGHPGILRFPARAATYYRLRVSEPALVQIEGVWVPVGS